jgi:hypothetical protein
MSIEKFSDEWLFLKHSKSEIRKWSKDLKYFYFVRAWGGHNNDGDRFMVYFSYSTKDDLLIKINRLGVKLNILPCDTPKPIPGVSYPSEEFEKFKLAISKFPDLEQPGITKINGFPCHIYISDTYIQISVSGTKDGNYYAVTNADFENSKKLEEFFDSLIPPLEKDLEIEKDAGCVSKHKYPELFD